MVAVEFCEGPPAGTEGELAADYGEVGRGWVAVGGEAGGKVLVDEDHGAGIYCVNYREASSSCPVVLCGGEPGIVMGVKITHNDDVEVLLLEEVGEVRCVVGWAGGGRWYVDVMEL